MIPITITLDGEAFADAQAENEALDSIRKGANNLASFGTVTATAETPLNGTVDLRVWADTPYGHSLPGGPGDE